MTNSIDPEAADYTDDPRDLDIGLADRLYANLLPIHIVYRLVFFPCWFVSPFTLAVGFFGWRACRHPQVRRRVSVLCLVGLVQTTVIGIMFHSEFVGILLWMFRRF